MAIWLKYVLIVVIGYLLGNISVGILISKLFGIRDIRKYGSGNAGSTNVLRTLGWLPSVLTLVGDCLKAYAAAQIGNALCGDIGLLIGGFAAILGHDFPVFFNFKGGKGIASSLGLIIAISPLMGLFEIILVVSIVAITRYMSIGSLAGCVAFPVLTMLMRVGKPCYGWYIVISLIAAILAIFQHRANIVRLINRNENRLDFEKISKISAKLKGLKNK